MKKFIYVALFVLSACGRNESKNDQPAPPSIPDTLGFSKPAVGAQLTQAQALEVKEAFSKKEMMVLPPGELIFPRKDDRELAKKEKDFSKESPAGYEMLREIRSLCSKTRPTSNLEAQSPTNGDTSYENLRTGDKFSFRSFLGALSGESCPVDATLDAGLGVSVDQIDQAQKTGAFRVNSVVKGKAISMNPKYSQLLQKRGMLVDSTLTGLASKMDTQGKLLVTYNLAGTYYSLEHDIPYSMKVQILSRGNEKNETSGTEIVPSYSEVVLTTNLNMPKFSVEVVSHIVSDGASSKSEIFVNGHPMSQAEFDGLFGNQNPAANSQSNSVLTTLQ